MKKLIIGGIGMVLIGLGILGCSYFVSCGSLWYDNLLVSGGVSMGTSVPLFILAQLAKKNPAVISEIEKTGSK